MLAHNTMHVSIYIRTSAVNFIQNSAKIYLNCLYDCFVESTFLCFVTVWEPNIPSVGTAWTTVVYCIMVDGLLLIWGLILWLPEQKLIYKCKSLNWRTEKNIKHNTLYFGGRVQSIDLNPHPYRSMAHLYNCAETVCVYIVSIGCIQSMQGVF